MISNSTRSSGRTALALIGLLALGLTVTTILPSHAEAQRWRRERLHRNLQRDGSSIRELFSPVVEPVLPSIVRILDSANRTVALGTIVEADGWIVTKASELPDSFRVVLSDGRQEPGRRVDVDTAFDLALVRIDASGLQPIEWSTGEPLVGQWAITPDARSERPRALGVVSVPPREIPEQEGMLGIRMDQQSTRPRVAQVYPKTGASAAGLRVGDVILAVDGLDTPTQRSLQRYVLDLPIGTQVDVAIERARQRRDLTVRLGPQNGTEQQELGGDLSDFRSAFPRALQHDSAIRPRDCGSPLLDVDGRALGLNIARASRTASYAIPAADVQRILRRMLPEEVRLETPAGSSPDGRRSF